MDIADIITSLWQKQLVSRPRVERALARGSVTLVGQWAEYPEAVRLTLAAILTSAVQRQLKALTLVDLTSRKEYARVRAASRNFQMLLMSLQERDDPPPLLAEVRPGRTLWDDWASGEQLRWETRGAKIGTEERALHNLIAFYQLVGCAGRLSFSLKNDSPLYVFLDASFKEARTVFQESPEGSKHRQVHSLGSPDVHNLASQRRKKALRQISTERVIRRLERYAASCRP